jgi:hypothetical protein
MRKHKVVPLNAIIRSGSVGSIPANLFRIVISDLGIKSEERYESLMARYIRRAEAYPDAKKRATQRQGLSIELKKESISWKTFMRGLEFLGIEAFTMKIHLRHRNGNESVHAHTSKILEDKDAGTFLANLLHKVFFDLHIAGEDYDKRMDAFISRSKIDVHKRQRAAIRSALSKEMLKPNITWKTFIKGLLFVGVSKFGVELVLTHVVRKSVTQHGVMVDIDEFDQDESEENEDG